MSDAQFWTHDAADEATNDDPIAAGRKVLAAWQAAQPDNYFTADGNLQRTLAYHWGEELMREHTARLYRFGGLAATAVDLAVREANETGNLPTLRRFDALGGRIEQIEHPAAHHEAGRHIYGSGVMSVLGEPGNNLLSLSLFYLSAQNGEAGHNCPLACTAGLIKSLQAVGNPAQQDQYLPRLLDDDYDTLWHGAQFVTEVQGGSDVGANATTATPLDPAAEGSWLLNGEKWFCSNIDANLALVTARVPGQGKGTAGLGLFLVPRNHENGRPNGLHVRRLKDKIGTRSLATAEVVFRDALAYEMGPVEQGIHTTLNYVINTSRVFNAVGTAGTARRAYMVAWSYAQYRAAFGRPIARFPLVQDLLAQMRNDSLAILSGALTVAHELDRRDRGEADPADESFLRVAINLNKYRSAVLAHEVILKGIEILGGNGAIESFSVLPRLLRDNIVYENWEGTHNVLMAQVQRDMRRHGVHEAFLARVRAMLASLDNEGLRAAAQEQLEAITAELDSLFELDELNASIYFRPLMERLVDLFYVACLAVEGEWEAARRERAHRSQLKLRAAHFYLVRRVAGRPARDIAGYTDIVGHLCAGL